MATQKDTQLAGKRIAFIGAGFMGEAIIRGLVSSGTAKPEDIRVYDPAPSAIKSIGGLKVTLCQSGQEAVREADMVLLAVKPQIMEKVGASLKEELGKDTVIVSIAAGLSAGKLESFLPEGAKVVRAMPNMAAAVGHSATAICKGSGASDEDMALAQEVFDSVGNTVVVEERLMDAVTGLSGSGPAYLFMFLEGLIDAGVANGLSRDAAYQLALSTVVGAALLARETGEHPSLLKERITSPGGTTIAALAILEEAGFKSGIIKAVTAATARSRELGK